ncbi:hypothetical protein I4F81_004837 [Pyropia yezoensis]|uniref:Uncharacterized protein n=1 Tax=Pyropia yezoensis TaxID=2788 RepID=A0ACC3BXF4_PYRYE|nr:hypothetical protein I4F81_004837 [Neopyropia yezoensis]
MMGPPSSLAALPADAALAAINAAAAAPSAVRVPTAGDTVVADECALSFDTPESSAGLYTSLASWRSYGAAYVGLDVARVGPGAAVYLHQQWVRVPREPKSDGGGGGGGGSGGDGDGDSVMQTGAEGGAAAGDGNGTGDAGDGGAKVTKMALGVPGGFAVETPPEYDTQKTLTVVSFVPPGPPGTEPSLVAVVAYPHPSLHPQIEAAVEAVLAAPRASRTAAVSAAAWEEEDRKESKYAATLEQLPTNGKVISPDPASWVCFDSGRKDNLWLNLSTGVIGSGRRNWDGSGGTGAALKHFEETGSKYPLVVKLGTITPHGADVYSYAPDEDDMVTDAKLAEHLAHWGIHMQSAVKTAASMTELQVDLNLRHEWDVIAESGSTLSPLSGPGAIGLDNLGNSCYMSSVLQLLLSIPEMDDRYVADGVASTIFRSAPADAAGDFITSFAKVASALLTDAYADPRLPTLTGKAADPDAVPAPPQRSSVRPWAFKALVGRGHPEFSTGRQQDASEFLQHLLELMARAERSGAARLSGGGSRAGADVAEANSAAGFLPTPSLFRFNLEDRLACASTGAVRYSGRSENVLSLPVPVEAATNRQDVQAYEERNAKRSKPNGGGADEEARVQLRVPFDACVAALAAEECITDWTSPVTKAKGEAVRRLRLRSFPDYLFVHLNKYTLADDWTPKKLDVAVDVPLELDLTHLHGSGMQPGETSLPEEEEPPAGGAGAVAPAAVVPDDAIVATVVSMGFSENGARRAAVATANAGGEEAVEWVMSHMGDSDFNDPLPAPVSAAAPAGSAPAAAAVDPASVEMLAAMGFTAVQARAALRATGGSLERAADWLFSHSDDLAAAVAGVEAASGGGGGAAGGGDGGGQGGSLADLAQGDTVTDGTGQYELMGFASHMGASTASGHYVAHVRKAGQWVIFNDEKVAVSEKPPREFGYLYLYRRK